MLENTKTIPYPFLNGPYSGIMMLGEVGRALDNTIKSPSHLPWSTPLIQIRNLHFSYQNRPILQNFNLTIKPGQLIHLQGPNGTGKTTLIRIIAGLLNPDAGEISAQDPSLTRSEMIEYLPSEANCLYGNMTAMENLWFWQKMRKTTVDKENILNELRRWNLHHTLIQDKLLVRKFSTGMKRRLALARLNLSGTPFWLLDEPLSGLDSGGIEAFKTILTDHINQKGSCLVVSHDTQALQQLNASIVHLSPL